MRQAPGLEIDQSAAAEVLDHRQPLLACQRHQLGGRNRLGEALHGVVRGVDLHDRRGVGADRGGVIPEMRAVGGANLDQAAAGACHDVGNAEGAADLNQLAARHDHLATPPLLSAGQGAQRQQHRAGIVVDGGGSLRPGQSAKPGRDVIVALAATAVVQLVFQRCRRTHRLDRCLDRLLRQERPAQVGMQHRAGEVEDAPLRRRDQAGEPRSAPPRASRRVGNFGRAAPGIGPGTQRLDHQWPAGALDQRRQFGPRGHAIN